MLLRLTLAAALLAVPVAAGASSPDAWNEFRAEVRAKCLAQAQAQGMGSPDVVVHPFGSESYGIAVLREGDDKRICIFDKRTKAVELT
ncbi:hypothetical protein [Phenylobacterium sp.]|uniref:hypothetical protein n=1 Tax=Phenylobacterium sp. TaxID=1871053 RepID=UPI00272F02D6|nr:hypothetical protein [Phenylobacterium sp.]MDP1617300.1 hypothetical protein [Phenylobacterium sp.]MDP1989214.1 hypothetical protein [Phenylobacterium sp.]